MSALPRFETLTVGEYIRAQQERDEAVAVAQRNALRAGLAERAAVDCLDYSHGRDPLIGYVARVSAALVGALSTLDVLAAEGNDDELLAGLHEELSAVDAMRREVARG